MTIRDEIENTLALYAWSYDFDNCRDIGQCFTADAVVNFDTGVRRGREEIVAELTRKRAKYGDDVVLWHVSTNLLIQSRTDYKVDAKSWFTFLVKKPGGDIANTALGYYDDSFLLDDGMWRVGIRSVVLKAF